MNKKQLRTLYRAKRADLGAGQREKMQDLMLIRFQQLEIAIPSVIMTYAPFEDEFDPQQVIDYCAFKNPVQMLSFPLIDPANSSMQSILVNDETNFAYNRYGIAEPVNGSVLIPEAIELVIVPLLAFDQTGNRVGYGKGYYDRFLKTCSRTALKIGFSYFDAVPLIEDSNEYDVRLDYCITPEKIYSFTD